MESAATPSTADETTTMLEVRTLRGDVFTFPEGTTVIHMRNTIASQLDVDGRYIELRPLEDDPNRYLAWIDEPNDTSIYFDEVDENTHVQRIRTADRSFQWEYTQDGYIKPHPLIGNLDYECILRPLYAYQQAIYGALSYPSLREAILRDYRGPLPSRECLDTIDRRLYMHLYLGPAIERDPNMVKDSPVFLRTVDHTWAVTQRRLRERWPTIPWIEWVRTKSYEEMIDACQERGVDARSIINCMQRF